MNGVEKRELMTNSSGYVDYTAYHGIMRADAPKPGEIWKMKNGCEFIIIAKNEGVCNALKLCEEEKTDAIEVTSKKLMYTVPYYICYVFQNDFVEFVKMVDENEFANVIRGVEDALCITIEKKEDHDTVIRLENGFVAMKEAYNDAVKKVKELKSELNTARAELSEARERLAQSNDGEQCGVPWEMMYNMLLDKLIRNGGV